MRGAVALCLLAAFGAAAWAEADPRFQPMDQFVVRPSGPGYFTADNRREPLVPIELDRRAGDEAFVQSRCAGLVIAVIGRAASERANPLTGFNASRGEPLEWAWAVDLEQSFPLTKSAEYAGYATDYFGLFGPVTTKQTFLDGHIYQRDKARCLPLLKYHQ